MRPALRRGPCRRLAATQEVQERPGFAGCCFRSEPWSVRLSRLSESGRVDGKPPGRLVTGRWQRERIIGMGKMEAEQEIGLVDSHWEPEPDLVGDRVTRGGGVAAWELRGVLA